MESLSLAHVPWPTRLIVENRWDENAGLRRDAIRSQVYRRARSARDLGDRSSWDCVLAGAGEVLLEQRLSTTPKTMKEVFGGCRGTGWRWRRVCIGRGSAVSLLPAFAGVSASGRVTKIAIDKRAREGDNKGHEESLAGVLLALGRLRGEEATGCGDPASNTEPAATTQCRTHRTLCSNQAGKCQHGDLQLSARDHRDRFKNGAHQASLQENERGKMRPGLETRQILLWIIKACQSIDLYPAKTASVMPTTDSARPLVGSRLRLCDSRATRCCGRRKSTPVHRLSGSRLGRFRLPAASLA
jgi:hypothetical protein